MDERVNVFEKCLNVDKNEYIEKEVLHSVNLNLFYIDLFSRYL